MDDRPGSPRLLGRLVGAANLAEDLGLARNEGVEARSHAEEVQGGRLVAQGVEGRRDLALRHVPERGELGEGAGLRGVRIRVDDVELRPVARRERNGLALLAGQPVHELRVLRRAHEELLPKLHGRAMV